MKNLKPIYNHCKKCFKTYDMKTYGIKCPVCTKKDGKGIEIK